VWAQDATWLTHPGSSDWRTASNWSPASVPRGVAVFGQSTILSVTPINSISISTLQFNSDAPQYSFTFTGILSSIDGLGIVNHSSNRPILNVAQSGLQFLNSSTANNALITTTQGFTQSSVVTFLGSSTAADARIEINTGEANFRGTSSAGRAQIISFTGVNVVPSANSAGVSFADSSTAANSTIYCFYRLKQRRLCDDYK
jgi:hypothetical protein